MEIIKNFLDAEIFSQELYEDIIYFITSPHIRNGEFEGNRFIIKKMDQLNFLIFPEDVYEDGLREISYATSMYCHILLDCIQVRAKEMGLKIIK